MSLSLKARAMKQAKEKTTLTPTGRNSPATASVMASGSRAAIENESLLAAYGYSISTPVGVSSAKRDALVSKLKDKEYRDAYVRSTVVHGLAHQVRVNREERHLTQEALAKKCGHKTTQVMISRIEDTAYENFTLNTVLKVASALDVAVILKLVPYSKFILETADKSVSGLFAKSFTEENLYTRQATLTLSKKVEQQYDLCSIPSQTNMAYPFINSPNHAGYQIECALAKTK